MIRKVLFSFQASIIVALLNLVITILTAKYLGAFGRGELTIIITYIAFVQIVNEIIGTSSVFYMLNKFTVSEIVSVSSFWFLIISVSSTYLLMLFDAIPTDLGFIIFFSIFLFAIHNLLLKVVLNKVNLRWYNTISILQPLIIVILVFIYGYEQLSVKSFLLSQLYTYLGLLVLSFILLNSHFTQIRAKKVKLLVVESFKLGITNQAANLSQNLNYRLSYLFLQKFWSVSSVGVFSIVLSVVNVIWLFSSSISTLLNNEITKTSCFEEKVKLTNKSIYLTLMMTTGILVVFLLIPTSFYVLLLNKDFLELKRLVLLMAPAILIFSLTRVISHFFSGIGLMKYNFFSSFIGLLVTFIASPILIKSYNLEGATLANSLSYIASSLVLFYFFRREKSNYLNK